MKRLAWLTDIHLNFVSQEQIAAFARLIQDVAPDVVMIGGDIGEADSLEGYLTTLAELLDVPIYFVLGNHDYYRSSIAQVREQVQSLSRRSETLKWLPDAGVVQLTGRATLIGHGGWGDGRAGDFLRSGVVLTDYALIRELQGLHRPDRSPPESILTPELLAKLNALGDEAAAHFRRVLPEALARCDHVLALTHVPPFREACWHQGRFSDDQWAPHFTCQAVGDVLAEIMRKHPDKELTVFCGHTHSSGHAQILDNLEVCTGEAEYGDPKVQQVLEVK